MAHDDKHDSPKCPRVWPGMPTKRSKLFELVFGLFPIWIILLVVSVALMLELIQSCRALVDP